MSFTLRCLWLRHATGISTPFAATVSFFPSPLCSNCHTQPLGRIRVGPTSVERSILASTGSLARYILISASQLQQHGEYSVRFIHRTVQFTLAVNDRARPLAQPAIHMKHKAHHTQSRAIGAAPCIPRPGHRPPMKFGETLRSRSIPEWGHCECTTSRCAIHQALIATQIT
jgi:hypothetical protein